MKKCIEYIVFVVVLLVGRGEEGTASVSAESVSDSSRIAYRERTPGENFLQQYRDDPAFDYSVKPGRRNRRLVAEIEVVAHAAYLR